ncbi:MAG TPA: agmatinase [Vicinamibacterales bacterium]|nr:agmatinase [Vicinamibacterales bacterium]
MKSRQLDSGTSPRFAQPATFMRLPHQTDLAGVDVAILGVPFDSGTSYRSGARLGPREIRSQSSLIRPYSYFQRVSPFAELTIVDAGDVDAPPVGIEAAYTAIEAGVSRVLEAGAIPLVVGGDHSISLPCLRAAAKRHGPLALVQFDAHIDTWGDYFGGKYFHGSPFRRAIEERIIDPATYVQVGIRGPMYGDDEDFAFQRGSSVTTIDIRMLKSGGVAATMARVKEIVGSRPLYVTFDIDCVDPAYAPGTGTPEVGGVSSYEAQELVRALAGSNLVACDVVEVAPVFDGPGQITSLLAANIMFELLCVIALGRGHA